MKSLIEKMKILIVDDNYQIVETIADYLELEGMTADCAYHGQAALTFIENNHLTSLLWIS